MSSKRPSLMTIGGYAVGVCGIYFLSIGPMLRLADGTRFEKLIESFYEPVLALERTPAWPVLRWYLRVWDLYHPIEDSSNLPLPR